MHELFTTTSTPAPQAHKVASVRLNDDTAVTCILCHQALEFRFSLADGVQIAPRPPPSSVHQTPLPP